MAKITAYRKDTGDKVRVPEHWIGHPTLGLNFQKTKPSAAQLEQSDEQADDGADTTAEQATPARTVKKGR